MKSPVNLSFPPWISIVLWVPISGKQTLHEEILQMQTRQMSKLIAEIDRRNCLGDHNWVKTADSLDLVRTHTRWHYQKAAFIAMLCHHEHNMGHVVMPPFRKFSFSLYMTWHGRSCKNTHFHWWRKIVTMKNSLIWLGWVFPTFYCFDYSRNLGFTNFSMCGKNSCQLLSTIMMCQKWHKYHRLL